MAVAVRRGFSLDEVHSQPPLHPLPRAVAAASPTVLILDTGERAVRSRKIITYKFYVAEVDAFERPRAFRSTRLSLPLPSLLSYLYFFLLNFSHLLPANRALFTIGVISGREATDFPTDDCLRPRQC